MGLPYCFEEPESKSILSRLCSEESVDEILIREICEIELIVEGSGRAVGVYDDVARAMESFLKRQKETASSLTTKSQKN
jgi:hypothetical protein